MATSPKLAFDLLQEAKRVSLTSPTALLDRPHVRHMTERFEVAHQLDQLVVGRVAFKGRDSDQVAVVPPVFLRAVVNHEDFFKPIAASPQLGEDLELNSFIAVSIKVDRAPFSRPNEFKAAQVFEEIRDDEVRVRA